MEYFSKGVKPTINIKALRTSNKLAVNEILYGIEEEGIPYTISYENFISTIDASIHMSSVSPLDVGIAIDNLCAMLFFSRIKNRQPLFNVPINSGYDNFRILGKNAARLVKKTPFEKFL